MDGPALMVALVESVGVPFLWRLTERGVAVVYDGGWRPTLGWLEVDAGGLWFGPTTPHCSWRARPGVWLDYADPGLVGRLRELLVGCCREHGVGRWLWGAST